MTESGATSLSANVSTRSATSFTFPITAAQAAAQACCRVKMNSGRRQEHMDFPIDPKMSARGSEDLEDLLAEGGDVKPENSNSGLEVDPEDLTRYSASASGSVSVSEEDKSGHSYNSDSKLQSDVVKVAIDSATITSGQEVELSLEAASASVLNSVASGDAAVYQYASGEWKEVKGSTLSVNTLENTVSLSLNSVSNAYLQNLGLKVLESMPSSGLAIYQAGRGYVPLQASSQEGTFSIRTKAAQVGAAATKYVQYNFPNPFNLKTKTVSFVNSLGSGVSGTINGAYIVAAPTGSGSVSIKIKIFNLAGDLVREFNETGTAGSYNYVHWDGKNSDGSDVASGVYFAVVDAPGSDKKKPIKMVVVK